MDMEMGECTEIPKNEQGGTLELVVLEKGTTKQIHARIELVGVDPKNVQTEDCLLVGGDLPGNIPVAVLKAKRKAILEDIKYAQTFYRTLGKGNPPVFPK